MGSVMRKSFYFLLSLFLLLTSFGISSITVFAESNADPVIETVPEGTFRDQNTVSLSNYVSKTDQMTANSNQGVVTLSKAGGDHHAIANQDVMYKSFIYEADVTITEKENNGAAGLSLYRNKENVTTDGWFAANFIPNENRIRFFRVNANGSVIDSPIDGVDSAFNGFGGTNHLRLQVSENGSYAYTVNAANGVTKTLTGTIDGWYGAYLGLLTFNASAQFSNITITDLSGETPVYFNSGITSVSNTGGDHGVFLSSSSVQGRLFKNFSFETDATIGNNAGEGSGALLLGYNSSNPVASWTGINFHKNANVTKIFGTNTGAHDHNGNAFDFNHNIHLCVSVDNNGSVTYKAIDSDGTVNGGTTTISNWNGAYLGLLTFNSEVNFYNTRIVDYNDNGLDNANGLFHTDLTGLDAKTGNWNIDYNGLKGSIPNDGDAILLSGTTATDFVYEADVKFNENRGAASLVMRSDSDDMNNRHMYVANLNGNTGEARLFKFEKTRDANGLHTTAVDLANSKRISLNAKNEYHLKVVAIGKHFVYYINGQLVINTADYTGENPDAEATQAHHGQNDAILEGKMGLMTWNGNVSYQNVKITPINNSNTPQLDNLTIANATSDIDKQIAFMKGQYVYLGYVKNGVNTVSLNAVTSNGSTVTVKNALGETCDITSLPVSLGENIYTLEVQNGKAKVIYKVQLYRCQPDETYYNEDYRGQYHYSVKDGWANDPNGMVYYNGVYHLFYQFYDATTWGPMHWAHATSTDLIHWEEQPIALYPDEYGTMFSGCAVVANHDTAPDVFAKGQEGIVLFITANGTNGKDGQRMIMAYSLDGETWHKKEDAKVLLDWTDDDSETLPEHKSAFRDPKVFRYDNKWFMVIAGGPLRIYSSNNLIDWTLESAYRDLHTECPDLYPLECTDENGLKTVKWVLDRGGRYYKVGDFRQVDGKYRFVPDDNYVASWYKDSNPNDLNRETNYKGDASIEAEGLIDGIMNFGADYYAAMTYYVRDFGTAENVTVPRLIAINWMNTWDDYCRDVANKTGNEVFNGTFNLQVELGLTKDSNGKYVLTQSPIKEYETLRQAAVYDDTLTVTPNNNLFEGFNQSSYEIVANFKPEAGTKEVGFNVRVGDGQKTVVKYNFETKTVSIDRSQSGIIVSGKFAHVHSQNNVTTNADGSIDLHIYVDRASVEVYTANDTVSGADQIFPNATSNGLEVFSTGGNAVADIAIYPLKTIWNKQTPSTPTAITVAKKNLDMYVYPNSPEKNDSQSVAVWTTPVDFVGDAGLTVSSDDPNVAEAKPVDGKVVVEAKGKGNTTIHVGSTKYTDLTAAITVNVRENKFNTNLEKLTVVNGGWYIDGEELKVSNNASNDIYMSALPMHQSNFIMEADMMFTKGMINFFIASSSTNPFADGGAYSVQFNNNSKNVRLFRFGGDTIIEEPVMNNALNDGQYHHIKMEKMVDSVRVYVDDMNNPVLSYTFADANDLASYFTKDSYVGLGLWDGNLNIKNLIVTQDADYSKVDEAIASKPSDLGNYVQGTVDTLNKAIANVVKGLDFTKQSLVDDWAKAIKEAIKGLKLRGDSKVDLPAKVPTTPVDEITIGIANQGKVNNIILDSIAGELKNKVDGLVGNGENVIMEVVISEIKDSPTEQQKQDMTSIKSIAAAENMVITQYLDLSIVVKKENNEILGKVEKLTDKITYEIAIPEELKKEGRIFKVIRIYNGQGSVLDTKEENGILSFETDRFSTYALAYVDPKTNDKPSIPPVQNDTKNPSMDKVETGDRTNAMGLFTLLCGAFIAMSVIVVSRKQRQH